MAGTVQVNISDSEALNKILMLADGTVPHTVTNLFTFDRGAAAPFAVGASSTKVANFNADKLDDQDGSYYLNAANFTGALALSLQQTILTTTVTGTQDNFNPGTMSTLLTILRCNNATLLTIDGFANPVAGQVVVIQSVGAGQVNLAHEAAGSTAANRLTNWITSGVTPLAAGAGVAIYAYDATLSRFRLISHSQGAGIGYTPTWSGNGAMTYTSASGNPRYMVVGKQLYLWFDFTGTVGGTPSTAVQMSMPNNYTSGFNSSFGLHDSITDNRVGLWQCGTGNNNLGFFTDLSAGTNWTAGTRRIVGQLTIEVT